LRRRRRRTGATGQGHSSDGGENETAHGRSLVEIPHKAFGANAGKIKAFAANSCAALTLAPTSAKPASV
jgi:hypothetical protein